MLNKLSYNGPIIIDNLRYNSVQEAIIDLKGYSGKMEAIIPAKNVKTLTSEVSLVKPEPLDFGENIEDGILRQIHVKPYLLRPASETFNFHERWNNNNPMPYSTMNGYRVRETLGMYYMRLYPQTIINPRNTQPLWEGWIIKSAIISDDILEEM